MSGRTLKTFLPEAEIQVGITLKSIETITEELKADPDLSRKNRRSLVRTLGNTASRERAAKYALKLSGLYYNGVETEPWTKNLDALLNIEKIDAYRALSHFPNPVVLPKDRQNTGGSFYVGVSLWMTSREIGESTTISGTLGRLGFRRFEPYATVSRARFQMIERLCEMKKDALENEPDSDYPFKNLPFVKPAVVWLLAEASDCRSRYENSKKQSASSKGELYQGMRKHIDSLIDENHCPVKTLGWGETIEKFCECVEGEAMIVARRDPAFRQQFLVTYKRASTAWNSHRRSLGAVGLKKVKPGSKPRSQNYKCNELS